jgi:hypothetical protein
MASENSRVVAALTREIHEAMRELRMLQSSMSYQLQAARKLIPVVYIYGVIHVIGDIRVQFLNYPDIDTSIRDLLIALWTVHDDASFTGYTEKITMDPVFHPRDMREFLTKVIEQIDIISLKFANDDETIEKIRQARLALVNTQTLIPA